MLNLSKTFVAAIGAAGIMAMSAPALAQTELKLANFIPPQHPMNAKVFMPLAEQIAEVTGGEVTVKVYPAGELGAGPQRQFSRVLTGVAEIGFGLQGYTSSQFPRTLVAELPGMFPTPEAATEAMWSNFDLIAEDYKDTKVLALWVNAPAVLLTRDTKIETADDLAGLTIRAPSAIGAQVLEAWGANAVTMPVTEAYNALQTGVLDGIYIGADAIRSFRLHEVTSHATFGIPNTVTTFFLLMNKDAWNGLNQDQQDKIDSVVGQSLSMHATEVYGAAGQGSRELLEGLENYSVTDMAADESARMTDMLSDLYLSVAADLDDQSIDGSALVSALSGRN